MEAYCRNCGHTVGDAKFCSTCGQKNTDGRISFKEFITVVFSTVFNLESKFFKTIRDIFSPGKLTVEWFKGRHKPYFHPVRLFIVTALLLIAAVSLFISDEDSFMSEDVEKAKKETFRKEYLQEIENYKAFYLKSEGAKEVVDNLSKTLREGKINSGKETLENFLVKKDMETLKEKNAEEIISYLENKVGQEMTDSIINLVKSSRSLAQDSIKVNNLVGDRTKIKISNEDFLKLTPTEIADKYEIEGFFKRLSLKQRLRLQKNNKNLFSFVLGNSLWVALLMMPFLAFILKLLYIRHNYFVVEHLIFSFHAHSFAFMLFTVLCIFMKIVYMHPLIVLGGFLLLFIYLYKALRKVYKQGRFKTILKLLFANATYIALFCLFALLGFVVSVFLF